MKYEESLKFYRDLKNSLDTAHDEGFKEAEEHYLIQLADAQRREEEERQQKEEERRQKEEERRQKEEERREKESKENTIILLIKQLHKLNTPIDQISRLTGKSQIEIKKILDI